MNSAGDLVLQFIAKSGGIEKIREVLTAFRQVPDKDRAGFVRRLTARDPAARQLMAAAILGFTIASEVYDMHYGEIGTLN